MIDLAERLRPFQEAGLIETLPTRWQRVQGMLEMALYVVSPDATDRERYRGAPLGQLPAHVGQLLTARLRHAGAPVAPGA